MAKPEKNSPQLGAHGQPVRAPVFDEDPHRLVFHAVDSPELLQGPAGESGLHLCAGPRGEEAHLVGEVAVYVRVLFREVVVGGQRGVEIDPVIHEAPDLPDDLVHGDGVVEVEGFQRRIGR